MIRHTGGFAWGATSTRSRSCSWARRSASCVDTIPICAPSAPTRRTSGARIRSLMRGSIETPHHLRKNCAGRTLTIGASGKEPEPCSRKYRGLCGGCRYPCSSWRRARGLPGEPLPHLLLNRPDVRGLLSLLPVNDLELDLLSLMESSVPVTLDGREMDEQVLAVRPGDEAVPLLVAEPLDGSLRHRVLLDHSDTNALDVAKQKGDRGVNAPRSGPYQRGSRGRP